MTISAPWMVLASSLVLTTSASPYPAGSLETYSLEQLRTLSERQLTHELLGAVGDLVSEARIGETAINYSNPAGGSRPLFVELSTAPKAVSPGLCGAIVFTLEFEAHPEGTSPDKVSISSLHQEARYRVVGKVGGQPDFWVLGSKPHANAEAICARSGPVLLNASTSAPTGFFRGSVDEGDLGIKTAAFAARAIELAQGGVAANRLAIAECTSNLPFAVSSACLDRKMTLAHLKTDALRDVRIERCESNVRRYCLTLEFARLEGDAYYTNLLLQMPAQGYDVDHDLPQIDKIEIESGVSVF